MTENTQPADIRWHQRLNNYLRALAQLQEAVHSRPLPSACRHSEQPEMTETRPFGLAPNVIAQLRAELARTPHLQRALIFGSRAKGNYRHGSDIDIALFGPQLTLADLLDLDGRIDDLLLPYQVDLCQVDTLENAELLDHIERVGQPLYPAP